MIRDLLQHESPAEAFADVAVVGGGAAGIVLAVELARMGRNVFLIEGGGAAFEESSQELYQSELLGLPHRGIHTGRFRVQGGTTTMWGGQIGELEESDFQRRPWVHGSGWPICKADLAPYYARALELEGVAGSNLRDDLVWKDLRQPAPCFSDLDVYLTRWCPEPNFARLHRRSLEEDPRIQVWLHANAVELLMDGEAARGIRCRTLAGTEIIFRAKQFVFTLGAIESSRFFLQPRSDGTLRWNRSGLLGRHFQDHIDTDAATIKAKSADAFHSIFDSIFLRGYKYSPKLRMRVEKQRDAAILNVGATIFSVSDVDEALVEVKSTAKQVLRGNVRVLKDVQFRKLLRHGPSVMRQAYRYAVKHRGFSPDSAEIRLRVHCEQQPDSESAITLSDQRDRLGLLRTRLLWKISAMEIRTIQRFVEVARTSLASVAEVNASPALLDGDDRYIQHCQDSFHHIGGMRMHPSPSEGVVDTDLRLHGTRNIFVCSSAVFPTSGFSNPTHTILALAVRLADHISGQV